MKITSLSVNPKIFKLRLIAIGLKVQISTSVVNEILPNNFKFSFFKNPTAVSELIFVVIGL